MQPYTYREMDGAGHSKASLGTPRSTQGASNRHPQSARFSQFDDSITHGITHSITLPHLPLPVTDRRANKSSATWTSSSGDLACLSDTDDVQDRPEFAQEYNRLARKVSTNHCRRRSRRSLNSYSTAYDRSQSMALIHPPSAPSHTLTPRYVLG